MSGWTATAVSGVYMALNPANFNEDQKKIYSEYNDVSSRFERTLEQVEEIAEETTREIENLRQIVQDYKKTSY